CRAGPVAFLSARMQSERSTHVLVPSQSQKHCYRNSESGLHILRLAQYRSGVHSEATHIRRDHRLHTTSGCIYQKSQSKKGEHVRRRAFQRGSEAASSTSTASSMITRTTAVIKTRSATATCSSVL